VRNENGRHRKIRRERRNRIYRVKPAGKELDERELSLNNRSLSLQTNASFGAFEKKVEQAGLSFGPMATPKRVQRARTGA
jgi:hypothetical protein